MEGRAKILLVDDDPDIIRATSKILQTRYDVTPAANGLECLECIRRDKPDLIILDMLMPKMDGFAVCRNLKENVKYTRYSDIPILIVTSVREDASRRRYELETGLDLDVDDYVEKPIKPIELLHRVEKILQRRGTST